MCSIKVFGYWSLFITLGTLHCTRADKDPYLRCYNGTLARYFDTPLDDPLALLDTSLLDASKNTTFYTYGFRGAIEGENRTTGILTAFVVRDDANLCALVWDAQVANQIEYPIVVDRAMKVAVAFAQALKKLIEKGIRDIHLVGHSIGAHLMGWAGADLQNISNYKIPRITGLDPAGPLFEKYGIIPAGFHGLKPTDAGFVDALHTNPGYYGTDRKVAHADFWANCGPSGTQPGCTALLFPLLCDDCLCSHDRSLLIYSEALSAPDAFPAAKAASCSDWKSQESTAEINYVGDNVNPGLHGDFFFSTNAAAPYSKGKAGLACN